MPDREKTILERWDLTAEELTAYVDQNPSLRGMLLGYIAEMKLRTMWFSGSEISHSIKHDDHSRKKKGDLVVTYKSETFIIESKSLQTAKNRKEGEKWIGLAQCDASDKRKIPLPDGTEITTTNLLVGEFDVLAVNVFSFENEWRFVFAKNSDLPRSTFRDYTPKQRSYLLATLVPVSWPPEPPFYAEPFRLLDEISRDRARGVAPPVVEEVARLPKVKGLSAKRPRPERKR